MTERTPAETKVTYEQRHLNSLTGKWSDWYASSRDAYTENKAGQVKFYQVRAILAAGERDGNER